MNGYYFDSNKRFIIEDYHKAKTFSSFLPGIAGKEGIPIWAFYVNRGQGISSFGVQDKNNPMMEFYPANSAYQTVTTNGFRTFIKDHQSPDRAFEPFGSINATAKRKMGIEKDGFFVEESNAREGLTIHVRYSTLANVPFGGLIRQTIITNDSDETKNLDIIDGMPALLPFGIENATYKAMSNLMQSWMEVSHKDSKVPFYKLRSSTKDASVVSEIKSGYFYISESVMDDSVLNIYDPKLVFDYQMDLREPIGFIHQTREEMMNKEQVFANKVPSAFQMVSRTLAPGQATSISSIIGFANDYEEIEAFTSGLVFTEFIDQQFAETKKEINGICDEIETHTGMPLFDEYMKQSYLDNVLRGGQPCLFDSEEGKHVYHIYSRKHGDMERDYNFFSLEPSPYSQGNGNYRDVNQNRRNDVIINPEVKDFNVWMFYSLIQADGYNPLSIKGTVFSINEDKQDKLMTGLLALGLKGEDCLRLMRFTTTDFTPGHLVKELKRLGMKDQRILNVVLKYAEQEIDVDFGEGFWSDHFTYNLDLVESYQYIYPDKMQALFFERNDYKFYNAPYAVLPRDLKYGLNEAGEVRQYEAIIKKTEYEGSWLLTPEGQVIKTNLFNKMMVLVLTKFMNLDPFGMGIEMEGDKPGWNDALNGLPGLFGSGMSETIELTRSVDFLLALWSDGTFDTRTVELLVTTHNLLNGIGTIVDSAMDDMSRWEQLNVLKESYRSEVGLRMQGDFTSADTNHVQDVLKKMSHLLHKGIEKAELVGEGIMPSYFINKAESYELCDHHTHYGLPAVKISKFSHRKLPLFLEGPARYLKTLHGDKAEKLHGLVTASDIYDRPLGMYKTSESLDKESMEIGRIRAFTPGWLERESVFMHMTYKYLLGLLKAGLDESFFEAIKTNMVPFLDPNIYGRSTTENSSFIASSLNPNPDVVGQGFVARLSGSTAEAISMWVHMFIGDKGFTVEGGQLKFEFAPHLTSDFFDESGSVSFKLFGTTKVTYINPNRSQTFGESASVVQSIVMDGVEEDQPYLMDISARKLRAKEVKEVIVTLG